MTCFLQLSTKYKLPLNNLIYLDFKMDALVDQLPSSGGWETWNESCQSPYIFKVKHNFFWMTNSTYLKGIHCTNEKKRIWFKVSDYISRIIFRTLGFIREWPSVNLFGSRLNLFQIQFDIFIFKQSQRTWLNGSSIFNFVSHSKYKMNTQFTRIE